jgi:auxin efflux carrier family protein
MSPAQGASFVLLDPRVLRTVVNAVLKLLAAIGMGTWLARRKESNVLGPSAVQALSKLIYWLFQPSLVFCSVSMTLFHAVATPGGLSTTALAMMPMAAVLHIGFGYLAAHTLIKLMRIRSATDEADIVVCSTFGNAAPLPLVFVSSLFSGSPGLHADVTACISFYLLAWSPCFYTIAPLMMSANDESLAECDPSTQPSVKQKDDETEDERGVTSKQLALPSIVTPPVLGSVAGILVGSVPFLSNLLLTPHGVAAPIYGAINTFASAYLPSVLLVLAGSLVGRQIVPPVKVGTSNLRSEPLARTASLQTNHSHRPGLASMEVVSLNGKRRTKLPPATFKSMVCICLARFLFMPALTLVTLRLFQSLMFDDEVNRRSRTVCSFVVLLESCMPSAQNSVVLLQLVGMDERAGRMTRLLTALYVVSLLPLTILLNMILTSTGILQLS